MSGHRATTLRNEMTYERIQLQCSSVQFCELQMESSLLVNKQFVFALYVVCHELYYRVFTLL